MIAVIPGEQQGVVYTHSTDEMIMEIISLLKSPERRQQLGQAGLNYVTQAHSYDKIAHQLEARLEGAVKKKRE